MAAGMWACTSGEVVDPGPSDGDPADSAMADGSLDSALDGTDAGEDSDTSDGGADAGEDGDTSDGGADAGEDSDTLDGGVDAGDDGADAESRLPDCDGHVATRVCDRDRVCEGTAGVDVIVGTSGDDEIYGLGGADIICGGDGDDTIDGGDGHDRIFGGPGMDVARGGDGWDRIFGEGGRDTLEGGADYDILVGGDGDDTIDGGSAADLIEGNAGHDTIRGGDGVDYCFDATADTVVPWGETGACEYLLRGVETVEYARHRIDGVETPLLADLYECEDTDVGCREALPGDPPIVYAHGGAFWSGSRLDMNPRLYAAQLASMGFRVMSVDYRTVGAESGHAFDVHDLTPWGQAIWTDALVGRTGAPRPGDCETASDAEKRAFRMPVLAAIEDVLTAAEFARGLYELPGDQPLILSGSSAGAISSLYAAYAVDDLEASIAPALRRGAPNVQAVVSLWGGFFPTKPCASNMDALWMEPGEAALYVVHGDADLAVEASFSRLAIERAEEIGLEVVGRILPGAGHGFVLTNILEVQNRRAREVVAMRRFLAELER